MIISRDNYLDTHRAREALRPFLGPVLAYQLIELTAGNLLKQLTEQTRLPYHNTEALR